MSPAGAENGNNPMSDSFYRAFEDRHRGSRELIKSRLRAYTPFIQPLAALYSPAAALDLGCGRGEWLELLGETGFDAHGVDLDAGMLAACRERGLRVELADALATLRALPADSTALVSAFHVVEHLDFGDVQTLVREALRVLRPGGLLILETPNPENLVVGSSSFYLDPSHIRPIPPELLSFVAEHIGFHRNKVVRLQEPTGVHTDPKLGMFNVLHDVSPDYGVVAQKSAATDVLSRFDPSFQANYGISITTLAQRYDSQLENRVSIIEERAGQTEARAEKTAHQMSSRLLQIEERLARAEARAAQLDQVLNSRSWRITAPLRFVISNVYRVRAAAQEGRIVSGLKRRIKPLVRRLGQSVLRHPVLKQTALSILNRLPTVKARLLNMMRDTTGAAPGANHLSPRAARIYARLKKAVDARKN
jgi:SAM-dependent methyltransferase